MKKIVFIEPKSPGGHIFSKFMLPRLGTIVLGTMMKQRGWNVEVIVEDFWDITFDEFKDVDIVGISTITPTAVRAYGIADKIRQMGIPVIMGGPHVSYLAEEALEHADFVIRGEGEKPLMSFIDEWEKEGNYSRVPNLSYSKNNEIIHNSMLDFEGNLDKLPINDFSILKTVDPIEQVQKLIPVQTSRGCPFDCSFCSVTGMFGRQYRYRSLENILEELRQYKGLGKMIFFYDDHFAANKKRAKEILRAMIKEEFNFKWSTQVRVDIAKDKELVSLFKEAGCHTLFIGFESINPQSLKEMKKSQTVNDIIEAINVIQGIGIHIHGMFVYGFDHDNWKTVTKTIDFASNSGMTSAQFLILTPFPGSEFYSKIKNNIIFKNWSLYDAHHVVFQPENFSFKSLQYAQIYSHEKFYSLKRIFNKLISREWVPFGLAVYARITNWKWKRENKSFVKGLEVLNANNTSLGRTSIKDGIITEEGKLAE